MAAAKTSSSWLSYAAFLIVGLVMAYAFLGVQYSGQLAGKEAELGSLRSQYSGLQGELETARAAQSPSQQVLQLNACSDEKKQLASLQAQLAATKQELKQCVSEKSSGGAGVSPPATASAGFVGKTISINKDESMVIGNGVITLTYFGVDANGFAVFRLDKFSYTRAIGSFTNFNSGDGSKYVVTVSSATAGQGAFVFYNG